MATTGLFFYSRQDVPFFVLSESALFIMMPGNASKSLDFGLMTRNEELLKRYESVIDKVLPAVADIRGPILEQLSATELSAKLKVDDTLDRRRK